MRHVRALLAAPIRFYRYLDRPRHERKARFEAMPPEEKAAWRDRTLAANGLFLAWMKVPAAKPTAKESERPVPKR